MAAQAQTGEPKVEKEKDLFVWRAPTRPFKRHSRDVYVTLVSIAVLFGLILFLIDGILPVLLVVSVFFLFYVLSNVEPEEVEFRITSFGVRVGDNLTEWPYVYRYWFIERYGKEVLVFETANLGGRMELVMPAGEKENIRKILDEYSSFEPQSPSVVDKAAGFIGSKIQ